MFYSEKSFHSESIASSSNIHIWLHLTRVIQKLHYSSIFASFWKKIQVIQSFYPAATSSLTSELLEHILRRTSVRRKSLIAHTTVQKTPEEALRDSLTKIRDPPNEERSPLRLEHASKDARRTPTGHTSQWWYHATHPLFWGRDRSSRRRSASSVTSQWIPHTPLLLLAIRKSLQERGSGVQSEWRLQDKQDCREVTPSAKMRTGLIQSRIRRINQVEAGALPIFLDSRALLRKLMFCDKLIAKTDCLHQPDSRTAEAWQPFLPSPPSSSLISIGQRRTTCQPTKAKSLGARIF